MSTYLLDVRRIVDEIGGSVHASDNLDIEVLEVGEERFTLTEPATFDVTISNAGEGLVSIGRITANVKAQCVRCLCEFETTISGDVEGFWLRPGDSAPEDEDITGQVDGEWRIDLAPALEAALVVEAPFAPLHDEECEGLCASCGVNLNEKTCDCEQKTPSDSPFAALKDLVKEDQNQ